MRTREFESRVKERCRSGDLTFPEALDFFHDLLHFRDPDPLPSIITFNFLFTSMVRMGKLSILSLFNRLARPHPRAISPNVCTFAISIDCCTRVNQLGLAFVLLGQMHSLGVLPNTVTYTTLINGLCKQGAIEKALQLLDCMASKGLEPNIVTYNTLVNGLCKKGLLETPGKLLQYILYKGHRPNVITYTAVIDALCKEEEIEKAEQLLDDMISRGVQPDVVTYNTLIYGFCKMKELETAKKCMRQMVSKGISPSIVTWNIIIDAFCTTDDVMDILINMVLNYRAQDNSAYISLIKAYVKRGNIDEAMCVLKRLKQEGLKPDIDAYSPIHDMLIEMGRVDDAKDLIAQMNEKKADG